MICNCVHRESFSITAITDSSGNLLESLSYDPCSGKLGFCECSETKALVERIPTEARSREGRRRKATDWTDYNVTSTLFDRGFTGHEHLPHFGLINSEALHCISLPGLATANFSLHCVRKNQASANMNGRVSFCMDC
ncbi:MAG: hypothetical protein Q8J88_00635 [Bacteroidales bacterium]|nr:hypothetical protein [Bacteroidales bacterium]